MTVAVLSLSETFVLRLQCVRVYFVRTKNFSNLSTQATINVLNARQRVRCAISVLKNRQICPSWSLVKGSILLRGRKNQCKMWLEICFVQHFKPKIVLTFQPTTLTPSSTMNSLKPALTRSIVLNRTKNWQLCRLVVMVHTDLQES